MMIRIHIKQGVNEEDPFSSSTAFIQLADEKSKKKKNDYESLVSTGVDYRSLEGNKVRAAHEEDVDGVTDVSSVFRLLAAFISANIWFAISIDRPQKSGIKC